MGERWEGVKEMGRGEMGKERKRRRERVKALGGVC